MIARIWRNRIIAGTQAFANCPERYKDDVRTLLRADVESDTITAEVFETLTGEKY